MKRKLAWLPLLLLTYLSLEILFRRWVWHQIPTQASALFVYALLIVNAGLVAHTVRRRLYSR